MSDHVNTNDQEPLSSAPPQKRVKYETFKNASDEWDDNDDIFTNDQLVELDILATQAYNENGDNKSNISMRDAENSQPSAINVSQENELYKDGIDVEKYSRSPEIRVEVLKENRYALEGEIKILRKTLKKRDEEIEEERKTRQLKYDMKIHEFKLKLAEKEKELEKVMSQLSFAEQEKSNVIKHLRESKPSTSAKKKSPKLDSRKCSLLQNNGFSLRFPFESDQKTKNVTTDVSVQTEVHLHDLSSNSSSASRFILPVSLEAANSETALLRKLLFELNVAIGLNCDNKITCQSEDFYAVVKAVKELAEDQACNQFPCDRSEMNANPNAVRVVAAVHKYLVDRCTFISDEIVMDAGSETNGNRMEPRPVSRRKSSVGIERLESFSFVVKILKCLLSYDRHICNVLLCDSSSFQVRKNNDGDDNVTPKKVDTDQSSLRLVANLYCKLCSSKVGTLQEQILKDILSILEIISSELSLDELPKLGFLITEQFFHKILKSSPVCNVTSTIILIAHLICQSGSVVQTLCTKSDDCLLYHLAIFLLKTSDSGNIEILNRLCQLISILLQTRSGLLLVNNDCRCTSALIQCFVKLIYVTVNIYSKSSMAPYLLTIKKGILQLRQLSIAVDNFKSIRGGECQIHYVSVVCDLACMARKQRRLWTDKEVGIIQELWDFPQDDREEFDIDKRDESFVKDSDAVVCQT